MKKLRTKTTRRKRRERRKPLRWTLALAFLAVLGWGLRKYALLSRVGSDRSTLAASAARHATPAVAGGPFVVMAAVE